MARKLELCLIPGLVVMQDDETIRAPSEAAVTSLRTPGVDELRQLWCESRDVGSEVV